MNAWAQLILAFVGAACGGVLTRVPPRALWACGAIGLLAYGANGVLGDAGLSPVAATFIAATLVATLGEVMARVMKLPAICFALPGILPLAPGVSAYESMYRFVLDDTVVGSEKALKAVFIGGAIAAGLVMAGACFRVVAGAHRRRTGATPAVRSGGPAI